VAITEAEWELMELLWQKAPRSSQELAAELEQTKGWKRATVVTLLGRLVAKGALLTEPQSNRFLYRPAIERTTCVAAETRGLLDRVFGGTLQPLLAHLAEYHPLTKKDVDELRALLDQIKPKH
jgi:predicted transcriptional regulator